MADTKTQGEPSMEEILASIRRIIAEDGEVAPPAAEGAAAAPAAAEPAPPPPPKPAPPPPAAAAPPPPPPPPPAPPSVASAMPDEILELTEVVEEGNLASPPPPPPPRPAPSPMAPPTVTPFPMDRLSDRLVSEPTAAVSVAALAQLAALRDQRRDASMPLGNAQLTIEELVRDLLRPMLREWLDVNLAPLVERLVRDEIARMIREAQR
jgi:uncharacterized protein